MEDGQSEPCSLGGFATGRSAFRPIVQSISSAPPSHTKRDARKPLNGRGIFQRKPDPTPEAIASRCGEIQAGWTDAQRAKRKRMIGNIDPGRILPWTVPELSVPTDMPDESTRWWYIV